MRSESGLENLLSEGIISEVLGRLQSGKEAEVFIVRSQGNVVAAKVYKDRVHRSFKNNSSYKEGRVVGNSRSQRAIERGSKYGKEAAEDAWKSAEVNALYTLHAANVRVPTPVLFFEGVLLMELVRDADGNAAPRLIDVSLTPEQAHAGYHDMLGQLVRMLSCELIHGDLSPYNVLWAAAGPTVIDFPQIVSASHNSSSERFFLRDAENILGHFARIDRRLAGRRSDASEIWRAYLHRDLSPDFLPTGKARPAPRPPAPRPPAPLPRQQDHGGRHPAQGSRSFSNASRQPLRQSGPGSHGATGAPPRQAQARPAADQRRRAPEVLLARPRRPGTDVYTPPSAATRAWAAPPQRPVLQASSRPAPRQALPAAARPAASPSPTRGESSRGSSEDSDRVSHRRRPRRRS